MNYGMYFSQDIAFPHQVSPRTANQSSNRLLFLSSRQYVERDIYEIAAYISTRSDAGKLEGNN